MIDVKGAEAFEIEVATPRGDTVFFVIDKSSFLLIRRIYKHRRNGKTQTQVLQYKDYQPHFDWLIPRALISNARTECSVTSFESYVSPDLAKRCRKSQKWADLYAVVQKKKQVAPRVSEVKKAELDRKATVGLMFEPDWSVGDPTWIYKRPPKGHFTRTRNGKTKTTPFGQGFHLRVGFSQPLKRSLTELFGSLFPNLKLIHEKATAEPLDLLFVARFSAKASTLRLRERSALNELSLAIVLEMFDDAGAHLGTIRTETLQDPSDSAWSIEGQTKKLAEQVLEAAIDDLSFLLIESKALGHHLQFQRELREKPPNLSATAKLDESQGIFPNGRLDAGETGILRLEIRNHGEGIAFGVTPRVGQHSYISAKKSVSFDLAPREVRVVEVPLTGSLDLPASIETLRVSVDERRGYGARPLLIEIPCNRLLKPELRFDDIRLVDTGPGTSGNQDGLASNGETVSAEVRLINFGVGPASEVAIRLASNDLVEIPDLQKIIKNLAPGEISKVSFSVRIPRTFDRDQLTLSFDAEESRGVARSSAEKLWPIEKVRTEIQISTEIFDGDSADSKGNRDKRLNNGEKVEIVFIAHNRGQLDAGNLRLTFESDDPRIKLSPSHVVLGDLPHQSRSLERRFLIEIPRHFIRQTQQISLKTVISQDDFPDQEDRLGLPFEPISPQLEFEVAVPDEVDLNEIGEILVSVLNHGLLGAEDVLLRVEAAGGTQIELYDPRGLPRDAFEVNLGEIPPSDRSSRTKIPFRARSTGETKSGSIRVALVQRDFRNNPERLLSVKIRDEIAELVPIDPSTPAPMQAQLQVSPKPVIFFQKRDGDVAYLKSFPFRFEIQYASSLDDYRLVHNGRLVALEPGEVRPTQEGKGIAFEPTVELDPGENRFEVVVWAPEGKTARPLTLRFAGNEAKLWVASIGVNQYKHPEIPDLHFASRDAAAIAEYYRETLRLPDEQILELYDQEATLRNIKSVLGTKLSRLAANENDTVVVYLSGHGHTEPDPAGLNEDGFAKYFLPTDADLDDLFSTALNMGELADILDRIRADRVVIIMDSCFSGAAGGRTVYRGENPYRAPLSNRFLNQIAEEGAGRVILSASQPNEVAHESRKLGNGHGVFTWYLLEGLKGAADYDHDRSISVQELYKYTSKNVAKSTSRLQNPQIFIPGHGYRGEILIGQVPESMSPRPEPQ